MIECLFYEKTDSMSVRCNLCPHHCAIPEGKRGLCRARMNRGGILYSLVYGRPAGFQADPIEKKPLYHFLPGSQALSFGTLGCNLTCLHCQNHDLSGGMPKGGEMVDPGTVIAIAKENGCESIAFTYNEPSIFYEYMLDIAKLAKKAGLRTVMVSNGYISKEPLSELCPFLDAANIDLKAFDEAFYRDVCGGSLKPVLDTLVSLRKAGVHLEVTNLLIPGKNDSPEGITALIHWAARRLGTDVPLHFSAFRPMHKMLDVQSTPKEKILWACRKAKAEGMHYPYSGNIAIGGFSDTFCPGCGGVVIDRSGFQGESLLVGGKCSCGETISGQF